MRIGLLSDTHGYLDPAILDYFAECDEIWHAGDVGNGAILDTLEAFRPVRAVFGNVDGPDVRQRLPENLRWECEGLHFHMTHIAPRSRKAQDEVVLVCGHSHILKVTRTYLNPGACGHQGFHKERTVLRFTVAEGKLKEMEAINLGLRGQRQSR